NNINSLIYNKERSDNIEIEIINEHGRKLNERETVDNFNEYFTSLPKKTIEKEYGNVNKFGINLTSKYCAKNSMYFHECTIEEISKIISNLKNSNSTGIDEISTKTFKFCVEPLSIILSHYINQFIDEGVFPSRLKIAKIIPIFKKNGSKSDIKNYRPISLLNVVSKIVEACLYDRLYSYLDSKNFFEKNQFGFTKKSNTTSACISFIDKIQRALNEKKLVYTIFLDVAKAFDCVLRELLLMKLEQLGIRGKTLDLFKSYICEREQVVQINNTRSNIEMTEFGIAQGSKLGPLLFNIYMNDIFDLPLNGKLQLYADDSSIHFYANSITELETMINEDLILISNWFRNNLLVLNADKTNILFYNNHQKNFNFPDFYLNNQKIERVNEMKYLGLHIDSDLNWNAQVSHVIKKIKPYVGIFRKIAFICGDTVKRMLYYSFFHSNILYLLTIWSGTKRENIKKIKTLQNKCLRNLFFNKYRTGNIKTDDLYKEQNIIEFENLIDLELKINTHKIIKKQLKADIQYNTNSNIHNHDTRQATKIHKLKTKNSYGALSVYNRGINAYNNLSSPLKKLENMNTFKKNIKKSILSVQFSKYIKPKKKRVKRLKSK
ncbi:MAG: reverse transcriptase family protein, partial [Bacteroidales bacterium]|nr:reverse transcriptase family protein [Bacteroidales bacterium]